MLKQPEADSFVRFAGKHQKQESQDGHSLEGIVHNIFTLIHDNPTRRAFIEDLFDSPEDALAHVEDEQGRLTVMRDNRARDARPRDDSDRYHYWFDFKDLQSPALQALVNDVLPAQHNAFSRAITPSLKQPTVKGQVLQATAHAVDFSDDGTEFIIQPVKFYLHQNYLITAHNGQNDSTDRAVEVLEEVPLEDKVPTRMMNFMLHDISQQYSRAISSLDTKRKKIANDFRQNGDSPALVDELNQISDKTNELDEALINQQTLIEALLEMSSLTRAGALAEKDLRQRLKEIENRMRQIDNLQRAEIRLADQYKIRLNERTQRGMNRLAAAQIVSLPILIMTGAMGMNVPLPFEGEWWNFFAYLGSASAVSGGLWAWIKHKKWF